MNPQQQDLYSGSGYKESGVFKGWKEKILIYNLKDKVLRYLDVDRQTQKQITIRDYTLVKLGQFQKKWVLQFKRGSEQYKFGWSTEKDYQKWNEIFTGKWEQQLNQQKYLEQFDSLPIPDQDTQVQLPSLKPKPSALSRNKIEEMIPFLPAFIQKDMEILLQNTLDNLSGFSDILKFKQILDENNAQLYQDPNDALHMKLVYYSTIEPRLIYDQHTMPTTTKLIPANVMKKFQIFPTKKGCSLIYMELDFSENELPKQHSARDVDDSENYGQSIKSCESEDDQGQEDRVRMVFTQKGFEKDGIYCIFRKYTGQEIYHDQIDSNLAHYFEKYKIIRSALVIQPSNKPEFKSQLIEEIYVDCKDVGVGEKMLKMILLNVTSIDKNLTKINEQIQRQTQNVIIKDFGRFDTLQISFRVLDSDRITSEQHQQQSREEFLQIISNVNTGEHILQAIQNQSNQEIFKGLEKQLQTTEEDGHFLYTKYYKVEQKKGGLTYHNEQLLKDQRSVLFDMIKRMGSNLISGKSVMAVSLPIQIFESRSFLERMARAQGHAPLFFEPAAQCSDPMEQMKQTIAFHMASFMMGIQQEKPFNPIIGETFQGRILGCPIYLEQTSHHPPISNYLMYGRDYKLQGSFCPIVNMGANSLAGEQHGHSIVHFNNTNLKFYYIHQPFTVYNIIMGQRNVNCHKRSFCFQPDLQLLAVIQFNPRDENSNIFTRCAQKIDFFKGNIFKVTTQCIERCKQAHKTCSGLNMKLKLKPGDVLETYDNIQGRWTSYLEINNKRYWDINRHNPYILELEQNPLPSDCLYRLDLLLMKMKAMRDGQEMKEKMEVDQRRDKKLRDDNKKKKR